MDPIGEVRWMVELFERDLKQDGSSSSKGNQLKWKNSGIWYKADYMGYEGLAEYVVSQLLKRSTLTAKEFTEYYPVEIRYKTQVMNGCKSEDFTDGSQMFTLERLFRNQFGVSLYKEIFKFEKYEDRLAFLVEQAERLTGLREFGTYMARLLTIDALFLNEDRHSHNISVLLKEDRYVLCPIYDNGAALLSDTSMDYPLGPDIFQEIKKVRSKTLGDSFDEQLDVAEKRFGRTITFFWKEEDVREILAEASMYSEEIRNRVLDILLEQRRRYLYLFD